MAIEITESEQPPVTWGASPTPDLPRTEIGDGLWVQWISGVVLIGCGDIVRCALGRDTAIKGLLEFLSDRLTRGESNVD